MESDTISVIIPVYKVEKYLDRCIRSVVDQTYKNLEIIIVDDGSPDRCGIICDEWAKKDKRIKIIHKENGGLSDARNAGLDIASGEYICFVDSDDYIHSEMYQRLYEKTKQYNADITICGFYRVSDPDGEIICCERTFGDGLIDKKDALKYLCRHSSYLAVWNKLYKRSLFHDLRFPKKKLEEDVFVMPRLYDKSEIILSVPDSYYYYVMTANSISRCVKTVKNLDGVEGYYNMLLFCENKGYTCLLNEISAKMIDNYMWNRNQISRIMPNEKKRLSEIKSMIRYGYLRYRRNIRIAQVLYVESLPVYNSLISAKNKLFRRDYK